MLLKRNLNFLAIRLNLGEAESLSKQLPPGQAAAKGKVTAISVRRVF